MISGYLDPREWKNVAPAAGAAVLCLSLSCTGADTGAAACPAPEIDRGAWETGAHRGAGVTFRVPPGFRHREFEVRQAQQPPEIWQAGRDERISVFVEEGGSEAVGAPRLPYHVDYSECRENIAGRPALIQAYREEDRSGEASAYKVYLTVPLRDGVILRLSGTVASVVRQRELLAMVRTMQPSARAP